MSSVLNLNFSIYIFLSLSHNPFVLLSFVLELKDTYIRDTRHLYTLYSHTILSNILVLSKYISFQYIFPIFWTTFNSLTTAFNFIHFGIMSHPKCKISIWTMILLSEFFNIKHKNTWILCFTWNEEEKKSCVTKKIVLH